MDDRTMTKLKRSDKRLLYGFLAMILIFGFLSVRSQQNADLIRQQAHEQTLHNYAQCVRSVENTTKINSANMAFIKFLESYNHPPKPAISKWIAIYEAAALTVPECGAPPK